MTEKSWTDVGAISGVCNHVGGPLGNGRLDGDYVVCPWHYYKFHWRAGEGEPGYETDRVPAHNVKIENGRVPVLETSRTKCNRLPHEPHPLARDPRREQGPIRVPGVSTTSMTAVQPRYGTSEDLLEHGLAAARSRAEFQCDTRLLRIRELSFRNCEGFYSKSARARTWPCSITPMDPDDQDDRTHELRPEPGDAGEPAPDAQQGRRVHHHRRAGRMCRPWRASCSAFSQSWAASSRRIERTLGQGALVRGGRKGHELDTRAQLPGL